MREKLKSKNVNIGTSGEHLVCSDLYARGHGAAMASAGEPYDVIADIDNRLIKIQVKTASKIKGHRQAYSWKLTTDAPRRRTVEGNVITYISTTTVDYLALVALDIKRVAYIPLVDLIKEDGNHPPSIGLREEDFDKYFEI